MTLQKSQSPFSMLKYFTTYYIFSWGKTSQYLHCLQQTINFVPRDFNSKIKLRETSDCVEVMGHRLCYDDDED